MSGVPARERLRRLLCRLLGHRWMDGGGSVMSFPCCSRCGKWERWR